MTARKPTRAKALGVSDEAYEARLAAQGGHCALCPSTPKTRRLHADHDHGSMNVRGLLCHRCNRALQSWMTRKWLEAAADYIDPAGRMATGAWADGLDRKGADWTRMTQPGTDSSQRTQP